MLSNLSRVCIRPECDVTFTVPYKADPKKYCSRSCAAKMNNQATPKRSRSRKCHTCDTMVVAELKYCKECRPTKVPLLERKIADVIGSATTFIHAQLRAAARKAYKDSGQPYACYNCKYNKHVDICHIKDLWQFDREDLVSETCGLDNIVALCKNCHWEFDNGYLTFNGIKKPWKPSSQADPFWINFPKTNPHGTWVIGPHWVKNEENVP